MVPIDAVAVGGCGGVDPVGGDRPEPGLGVGGEGGHIGGPRAGGDTAHPGQPVPAILTSMYNVLRICGGGPSVHSTRNFRFYLGVV